MIGMLNKHKVLVKFIHSCNTPKELSNAGNNGFVQSLLKLNDQLGLPMQEYSVCYGH